MGSSARDLLVRGTVDADPYDAPYVEGKEYRYPPLAMSVEALIVEQPDGSYVVDITCARAHYAPESGEVYKGEENGVDGFTDPGNCGDGLRAMPEAIEKATMEAYQPLF